MTSRPLGLFLALWLVSAATTHGATLTASNCSVAAVQTSIDAARGADVVVVPNGSCTWTSGVTIGGKGIHLKGQSAGGVLITHNGSGNLISISEPTSGRVELSNLTFVGGTGTAHAIRVSSGGNAVLIHDNAFTGNIRAIRLETNHGVIWSNTINTNRQDYSFVQCKPENLTSSWTTASTMGTNDKTGESNVYVEDNTITAVPLQAIDADDNCRIVIRHNTFDNSGMASHGADTSPIGNRHWELYDNTFVFTNFGDCDGSRTTNIDYLFYIRGGTGVIADNVLPDVNSCAWGDKSELKLTVQNLRRNSGPYPCWKGGWPAPHQIGQSHNGVSTFNDPVYIWGNTGGGNYDNPGLDNYGPDECGGGPDVSVYLRSGRDFVTGKAKPGYTKYVYPHPLRTRLAPSPPLNPRIVK